MSEPAPIPVTGSVQASAGAGGALPGAAAARGGVVNGSVAGTVAGGAQEDLLGRARLLIERAVRRRFQEGFLAQGPDGGMVTADQVERLLQKKDGFKGPLLEDAPLPAGGRLRRLVDALRLLPAQADLLCVLLAADADPAAARLLAYLHGGAAAAVTQELAFDIVIRPRCSSLRQAAALLSRCTAPQGALLRLGFILREEQGRAALGQALRLNPRLYEWLLCDESPADDLGVELAGLATLTPLAAKAEGKGDADADDCDPAALRSATAAVEAGGRLLLATGAPLSGRERLVQAAAARCGKPLLTVLGPRLSPTRLLAAFREACLQGAILCIRDADACLDPRAPGGQDALARLQECLGVWSDTVALILSDPSAPYLQSLRTVTTVAVGVPPFEDRLALWRRSLCDDDASSAITEEDLRRFTGLYNLGAVGISRAAKGARDAATLARAPLSREHVRDAFRQLFDSDLQHIAHRMDISQSWDDLVLPDDVAESISAILDRIRYRAEVMGDWGFARKLGKGLGLSVLFSGESGTGKSMAAGLIAKELGLDLYVIDLSRIMSKWLGETEKNLGRAFDAAEAGHVLLLFDEADTVLGRRSGEIRGAGDRHANLETNYILARLEQFQGVAFFTTNLPSAVDPAVLRRLAAQIHFPFPDAATRAELWRRMIPAEVPHRGIDFSFLGQRFEVTGGFIRNIVLRAAFTAARDGHELTMDHLLHAATLEYRERGALHVGGRLT